MSNKENQTNQDFSLNRPPEKESNSINQSNNFNPKTDNMIKFNSPKNQSAIIKVIGVGGGGSNAVNHMYELGIKDVDFIVCNTDAQVLNISPVPNKIQLGYTLTEGRGAGSLPEVGKNAAIENIEEIKEILTKNTKMLFITAGMGGGTGTGAAPVIAQISKEMGILTVGIVTVPFAFEGRKRRLQAEEGIKELRKHVDSLLIICNDKLRELYGNLELSKAFSEADNVLTIAAKGIAEIITVPGYINVDFEDVRTVMKDSGVAIMGSGMAEGENRASVAIEQALSSPLLNDNNIKGASNILLYIASGEKEVRMDEIAEITDFIQNAAGATAEVIWGNGFDASLGDNISITLISTGFESCNGIDYTPKETATPRIIIPLQLSEEKKEVEEVKEVKNEVPEIHNPITEISLVQNVAEPKPEAKYPTPDDIVKDEKIITQTTEEGFVVYVDPSKTEEKPAPKFNYNKEVDTAVEQNQTDMFGSELINNKVEANFNHKDEAVEEMPKVDKISRKRQDYLKELSIKLKNPNALSEIEKVPAYLRKDKPLEEVPHSSETQVSKYTLFIDDKDNKPQLKANNSFLHEKPD